MTTRAKRTMCDICGKVARKRDRIPATGSRMRETRSSVTMTTFETEVAICAPCLTAIRASVTADD